MKNNKIGLFRRMVVKHQGYRYWMRFKKPLNVYSMSGCMDDTCGDEDNPITGGCKCNNFYHKRNLWIAKGFDIVAYYMPAMQHYSVQILTDGKDIVLEKHGYGR